MSKVVRVEKEIGGRTLMLETGRVAKLASAAVLATYGESIVLATVVPGPMHGDRLPDSAGGSVPIAEHSAQA